MDHFILLSSKNSMTEFIAHTTPAVNRPSKNIPKYPMAKSSELILPRVVDKKNPTHVEVHKGQLINSPRNLDFFPIHVRNPSNMDPYTSMVVIPYAIKLQKTNNPIIIKDTEINFKNQPPLFII